MKCYVYARVSTHSQNLDTQLQKIRQYTEFRKFEVMKVFSDIGSGATTNRPSFQEMMGSLEYNPFGIKAVVIYSLDRIGRNIRDLLNISDYLQQQKIGLIAIKNNIDTTTKEGRLFFYMMSAIAEYERELIYERTKDGVERAKILGKRMGRPKIKITKSEILAERLKGLSLNQIAKKYKVSKHTIYKRLYHEV